MCNECIYSLPITYINMYPMAANIYYNKLIDYSDYNKHNTKSIKQYAFNNLIILKNLSI